MSITLADLKNLPEADRINGSPRCVKEGETIPKLNRLEKKYIPEKGGKHKNT